MIFIPECDESRKDANNLGNHLFRDFSIIHRFTKKNITGKLREMNLTECPPPYLIFIHHNPGISQEELSCFFKIDKGAVAKTAGQMIKNGYIHRKHDRDDKRRFKLFLTKKGESAIPKLYAIENDFAQLITRGLTPEEIEQFQKLLDICVVNLLTESGDMPDKLIETATQAQDKTIRKENQHK